MGDRTLRALFVVCTLRTVESTCDTERRCAEIFLIEDSLNFKEALHSFKATFQRSFFVQMLKRLKGVPRMI